MFCLSWLITWYGHVLSEFRHIVRLYDFFMACHPLMPIYLAADVKTLLALSVSFCDFFGNSYIFSPIKPRFIIMIIIIIE